MKTRLIYLLSTFLICSFTLKAQTDIDALRYSQTGFGGTARSMGLSGATGALGADFGSLSNNPAGIAVYRRNEFTFSPSIYNTQSKSSFLENNTSANKYNFGFSNIGLVLTSKEQSSKWKMFSLGFGYNSISNFHKRTYYAGFNNDNSLLDNFLENTNNNGGTSPDDLYSNFPFGAGLAWDAFLLNPTDASLAGNTPQQYSSLIPNGGVWQSKTTNTIGRYNDLSLTGGANYEDRVYFGMSIGFPSIRFRSKSTYTEEDIENNIINFNEFSFTEDFRTTGNGINAKLGMIYKPTNWLRFGGAIHAPTMFFMRDVFIADLSAFSDSLGSTEGNSPDGLFRYRLITPWRAVGSVAFVFKKIGFLSVDYEFVDYGTASYTFNTNDPFESILENDINQTINTKYGATSNVRIGAEVKAEDFRIRVGYAIYGSPFNKGITFSANNKRENLSFGFGYRGEAVFIDMAYVRTQTKSLETPYTLSTENVPSAINTNIANNIVFTVGVLF